MEPLSVTASIIAVLQLSNLVISVCYDYASAATSFPSELQRVTEEVQSLRNVLETLAQVATKEESADPTAQSRLPTLKLLCEPGVGPLARCLLVLKALESKLAPPSWGSPVGSKRRALIQALGWPLKEAYTKKTLEHIALFKATLDLAITADHVTSTLAIQDMVRSMQQTTLGMQGDLVNLNRMSTSLQIDNYYEKIHRWLSAPDPSLNHNEARKEWRTATGEWFIGSKQFADWKSNLDSFLWLHGILGCGKTILSSTVIEHVLERTYNNPGSAMVYFYFDFNDIEKQQYEKMIRSLITQLSAQGSVTSRALDSLFSFCMNGNRQPSAAALLTTLQKMIQETDETFIILDALDECKERQRLFDVIEEMVGWKFGKSHILVTSRDEKDIEEVLQPLLKDEQTICCRSTLVNNDIRAYVHERLQTDYGLRRWQKLPKVQEEIETTLVSKANGMFRWVACQLDTLRGHLNLPMLRKALHSLPRTLDETYAQILSNIDEAYRGYAFKILQWLAHSARPLLLEEIAEVLAVDSRNHPRFDAERRLADAQDVLRICSSLVTTAIEIVENPHGKSVEVEVRLAHFSVKEYLLSDRIQVGTDTVPCFQEGDANASITEVCLSYLLQFDKQDSVTSENIKEFPLARYAARYWTWHAQTGRHCPSIVDSLCIELCVSTRDAYVNWVRLFDLDYPWEPDLSRKLVTVPPPLYYASLAGLPKLTRHLLDNGADVNMRGGWYGSPLQAASFSGHDLIVQWLLEAGADINTQGGGHGSALQAASWKGHDEIVQRLLEAGADILAQGGLNGNALRAASLGGNDQIVQRLLEAGVDVDMQSGFGGTALQAASANGHEHVVQRLLVGGADVNIWSAASGNALQAAAAGGHEYIVKRLLEAGADVNLQGGSMSNALQAASTHGHDRVVQQLLKVGANANAQGGEYGNVLQAAAWRGDDRLVRRLLEAGADVNARGGTFGSALQAAASRGLSHVVRLLLEAGADVNAQGGEYGNAMQAAALRGHNEVVQMLRLAI